MSFNYKFVIGFINKFRKGNNQVTVLDFGCGAGEVVKAGIESGINIYGVDIYQGLSYKEKVKQNDLLKNRIFEIDNGKINFPDNHFDFIIANQVFEHVESIEEVMQILQES